ncbi:MAG: S16 family serine protease, partial [Actinomycetes bacterium]
VLIPARNARDLEEVPQEIRDILDVRLIDRMDQVLPIVLEPPLPGPPVDEDPDADPNPELGSSGSQ